jgi:hypothetical protein
MIPSIEQIELAIMNYPDFNFAESYRISGN